MIWFSRDPEQDGLRRQDPGQGLRPGPALLDYPQVKLMSVDPGLFDKLNIQEEDGHLVVPVSAVIPAYLMGSGLGAMEVFGSDYDIMTRDPASRASPPGGPPLRRPGVHPGPPVLPRAGLPAGLRHGGRDHPWRFHLAGHGPGVTPIMTCRERCWCPSWTGTPTSPSIWAPSSPGNPWILSNWEPAASAASSSPWQARPSGPDRDRHLQHGGPDLHRPAPGQRSMMAAIGITAPISLIVTAFTALLGNGGALCAPSAWAAARQKRASTSCPTASAP